MRSAEILSSVASWETALVCCVHWEAVTMSAVSIVTDRSDGGALNNRKTNTT